MNGYQAKSDAIIEAIKAIHRQLSRPEIVKAYKTDYNQDNKATESALMGIAQEITYPLWVDWQAIQERNKLNAPDKYKPVARRRT